MRTRNCGGIILRRLAFLAGALSATLLPSPAHADRIQVRVRWMRAAGDVAGYRVYARYAGDVYGDPIDVGMPAADGDTLSTVVKRVDDTQDYAFAVTAYWSDGSESSLSNEGFLRADVVRPVCAELHCDSNGCNPVAAPDGIGCFDDDPCSVGVCAAGSCVVTEGGKSALDLQVDHFKVGPTAGRVKGLQARATLPLGDAITEPFPDTSVEIRDASTGVLFYRGMALGSDFALKRRQNAFVYPKKRRRRAPAGTNGLKHVAMRVGAGGSALTVRARALDLRRLAADDSLMWVVRVGDRCMRALEVSCGSMKHGRMRCS
jgi:hypothetical protein